MGEKDREFVPVGVKTDVAKGSEQTHGQLANPAETKASSAPSETGNGTVNVSSNPSGADVSLDGNFVGNCPAALKISAGKHTVTVKMSGYKDWSRDITIGSGSEVQLTANLEK